MESLKILSVSGIKNQYFIRGMNKDGPMALNLKCSLSDKDHKCQRGSANNPSNSNKIGMKGGLTPLNSHTTTSIISLDGIRI